MSEKNIPHNKNALVSFSDAIESVANNVSQSVVSVRSRARGVGSGVIWSADGYIVTCNHLVKKLDEVQVGLGNGKYFPANIIGNDPYSDLALLKIELDNKNNKNALRAIEVGNSENLKAGQFILALANPYGEYPSITEGIITSERSSLGRGVGGSTVPWSWYWGGARGSTLGPFMLDNIVITDARLNPGYSGGPLVDVDGKMIGLNAAYISSRGIAIRVSKVQSIVDRLAKDGTIQEAYLGIMTSTIFLPSEVSTQLEQPQEYGLMVLSVEKDSAAKKAGLLMGDIIVKFDNEPTTSIHDLKRQLLKQDTIGRSAKLSLLRGEKQIELLITPEAISKDD